MIDPRLLAIKREFLLTKHKECEAIIMQDKFTRADVEKLQGYYNMCEEYAGFFREFISHDVVSMKADIEKILKPKRASIGVGDYMAKVFDIIDKKKKD